MTCPHGQHAACGFPHCIDTGDERVNVVCKIAYGAQRAAQSVPEPPPDVDPKVPYALDEKDASFLRANRIDPEV